MAVMYGLQNARELHGLSVKELSEISGVSWRYIYYLEKGQRTNPSHRTLIALAHALDTSVDSIVHS